MATEMWLAINPRIVVGNSANRLTLTLCEIEKIIMSYRASINRAKDLNYSLGERVLSYASAVELYSYYAKVSFKKANIHLRNLAGILLTKKRLTEADLDLLIKALETEYLKAKEIKESSISTTKERITKQ